MLAGNAANLENIDEVGIEHEFDGEVDRRHVEVFEAEAIEKNIGRQQLFAADVDRVLRQVEGVAQGDVAGGELDLRGKGLLVAEESTTARWPSMRSSSWLRNRVSW